MLDTMRKPFFAVALVLMALAFFIDIGASFLDFAKADGQKPLGDLARPGLGIRYLALVDGLLLYTVGLIGVSLLVPERIHGRIQGIATFIVGLLSLIASIGMIMSAIALLGVMVSLLLAVPFGTALYFAGFADFAKAAAASTLALIMLLKLSFCGFLVAAQQQFLQNKGLVLLILTALLANFLVTFLHGLVPSFLVSITDCIAALVIGVLGAIWSLVLLIGSLPAIVKALRVDRALA
ncbi:hypothetical protein [Methylomonas koyamae]|nr:hypothetical protein [Methylomonas koyamae]